MQNNKEKIKFTALQNELTHVLTSYLACNTGKSKMYLEELKKNKVKVKINLCNFISEVANHPEDSSRLNTATGQPMTNLLKSN